MVIDKPHLSESLTFAFFFHSVSPFLTFVISLYDRGITDFSVMEFSLFKPNKPHNSLSEPSQQLTGMSKSLFFAVKIAKSSIGITEQYL